MTLRPIGAVCHRAVEAFDIGGERLELRAHIAQGDLGIVRRFDRRVAFERGVVHIGLRGRTVALDLFEFEAQFGDAFAQALRLRIRASLGWTS